MEKEWFILTEKHEAIPVSLDEYYKWIDGNEFKRIIGKTRFPDNIEVSTVFLGLDHSFSSNSEPILFETMIFGGKHNDYQERHHTYDDAILGHLEAVKLVMKG